MITYWKLDTQWTRLDEDNAIAVYLVNTDKSWFVYRTVLTPSELLSMKSTLEIQADVITEIEFNGRLNDAQLAVANL